MSARVRLNRSPARLLLFSRVAALVVPVATAFFCFFS
jgi:hypothetical protein